MGLRVPMCLFRKTCFGVKIWSIQLDRIEGRNDSHTHHSHVQDNRQSLMQMGNQRNSVVVNTAGKHRLTVRTHIFSHFGLTESCKITSNFAAI